MDGTAQAGSSSTEHQSTSQDDKSISPVESTRDQHEIPLVQQLPSPRDFASTSAYLEHLTLSLAEAISTQQFESHWINAHLSPDIQANKHDHDQADVVGISGFFDEPRRHKAAFPEIQMRAFNPSANVDEKAGRAAVYCHFEITGAPPGISRQSMAVTEWKLGRERWMCFRMTAVRGLCDTGLPATS